MESGSKKKKRTKVDENSPSYINQREKAKTRKLRYLQKLTEEQKELKRKKDREYYRLKTEREKRKSIAEMTEDEKRRQRQLWRESTKKYRERKKATKVDQEQPPAKEPNSSDAESKNTIEITVVNSSKLKKDTTDNTSSMKIEKVCSLNAIEDQMKKAAQARNGDIERVEEEVEKDESQEFKVEIEIKQEVPDDPLDFDSVQVKTEPLEIGDDDEGESRYEEPVIPIKNEFDESVMVEDSEVASAVSTIQENGE